MVGTKTATTTIDKVICTSKKYWIVYVFPCLMIFLGLIFVLSGLKYYTAVGTFFVAVFVLKILGLKSTKWILTDNELIIKSGFLPWRKTYFDIPIDTIFEAYYRHNLLSNIFGYGYLYIRRTEGLTSGFKEPAMTKHGEIAGKINAMIRDLKKSQSQHFIPQQQVLSQADELLKLTELHRQGVLSDEEFQQMKQKLIN